MSRHRPRGRKGTEHKPQVLITKAISMAGIRYFLQSLCRFFAEAPYIPERKQIKNLRLWGCAKIE